MNKINYDKLREEIIRNLDGERPRLLLHSCCAPCSSSTLEKLTPFFNVTVFYYNPNIMDETEYCKRLTEQKDFLLKRYNGDVLVIDGRYVVDEFLTAIKGNEGAKEGGERCKQCYRLRLQETAKVAKELQFDYFTTTLSVSPHKNATWLNEIGEELQNIYGVKYLYADFKKGGGYLRSIELSKEYNLYRQDYCGCNFSKN